MRSFLAITLVAACSTTFKRDDIVNTTSDEARISIDRRALPLQRMPIGRWLAGLPMRGMADIKIDLAAPVKNDRTLFSQAHGTFAFACGKDCRLGDDAAQLEIRGQKIDVGHIDIEKLAFRGTVENGHATMRQWKLVSPDMRLTLDFDIALADDLEASTIEGCVRFAPMPGLDKRRPKTWRLLQTTGANPDRSGTFSIRITGTLGAPKRLAQECAGAKLAVN